MKENTAKVLRALFWVYVAWTFFHIAYVVNHEPFAFDAWNVAVDTQAKPPSLSRFFSFWHQQYTSSNPRIGQPLAYLAYKYWGVAEIGTALAYFALVLGTFVLGTGRWPDRRNGRDLATLAIAIGFLWFAAPNFPSYMFCRAYATNYVWAAAIQLWFVVVLVKHDATVEKPATLLPLYALFGVAAGMCNEHTGPTLLLFAIGYTLWLRRKHGRLVMPLVVASAGAFIGYALLFFAPGQGKRYDSLAERYTVSQQILTRGFRGNIDIFQDLLEGAGPLLLILAIVLVIGLLAEQRTDAELVEVRRRQRRSILVVAFALAVAILVTATIFASPKLGPRFYMHAMILLLAGVLACITSFLHRPKTFAPFVVFAVLASTYASARTIPMFTRLSRDSDRRLAELASTSPGEIYTAKAWEQVPESWWFLGDDVRDQKKQELVARYFALDRVLFRGADVWSTLGVTDVKLTMHYEFDQDVCIDKIDELDLKPYVGKNIDALHHAFQDAIAQIKRATPAHLKWVDLVASFLGTKPPMPPGPLYVARWREGVLEGYTAGMKRLGRSRDRQIILTPGLQSQPWDIYIVHIGDPPKLIGSTTSGQPLKYQPWASGQYWVLACKPDHCFVVFTVAHTI
jgi:hypothetical protein